MLKVQEYAEQAASRGLALIIIRTLDLNRTAATRRD
jgi:hypothetical protein